MSVLVEPLEVGHVEIHPLDGDATERLEEVADPRVYMIDGFKLLMVLTVKALCAEILSLDMTSGYALCLSVFMIEPSHILSHRMPSQMSLVIAPLHETL